MCVCSFGCTEMTLSARVEDYFQRTGEDLNVLLQKVQEEGPKGPS